MFYGPDYYLSLYFKKFGSWLGYLKEPPKLEAPLLPRGNPFEYSTDIDKLDIDKLDIDKLDIKGLETKTNKPLKPDKKSDAETRSTNGVVENVTTISSVKKNEGYPDSSSIIQNIRASDYVTPQKYLDGAEIPSYYSFQSNMIPPEDLKHGMHAFWEVDRRLTLPTRTHIRFLVTATDVLHAWSCPSLNLKADALPARVTRINTFILREGVFYGQCSEMCGSLHGFMPIVVEAVSPEAYAAHAKKFYHD